MTLPASGSISIADIATELGVSLPIGLTDSNVRALAGVPSGNIVLPNDFWGKSNLSFPIGDISESNVGFAAFTLRTDGTYSLSAGTPVADWVSPTSAASLVEIYVTYVGGSFVDAPPYDTWLAMTSERTWTTSGAQIGLASIQFRYNGGSTLKTISLSVQSSDPF